MKAIILAGGKSSRMGRDKALMNLGGKAVIQYVADSLSKVFNDVFISGNHPDYLAFGPLIEDVFSEKGPMGGICSALEYCREDIFVCSCDMPFVSPELVKSILDGRIEGKITVARYDEKIIPVLGIYPYSVLNDLYESIKKDHLRMTRFLEDHHARYISFDTGFEDQFLNLNTPENFHTAENMIPGTARK